jgi:hypothetical protein
MVYIGLACAIGCALAYGVREEVLDTGSAGLIVGFVALLTAADEVLEKCEPWFSCWPVAGLRSARMEKVGKEVFLEAKARKDWPTAPARKLGDG